MLSRFSALNLDWERVSISADSTFDSVSSIILEQKSYINFHLKFLGDWWFNKICLILKFPLFLKTCNCETDNPITKWMASSLKFQCHYNCHTSGSCQILFESTFTFELYRFTFYVHTFPYLMHFWVYSFITQHTDRFWVEMFHNYAFKECISVKDLKLWLLILAKTLF